MPYQLVSAKVRSKSLESIWEDADLSAIDINQIFASYSKTILVLSHTVVAGTFYLNLEDARSMIGVYTGTKTIPQWLLSLGSSALPTLASPPTFKQYPVKYTDVWRAGYKVELFDRTRAPDSQFPDVSKNDLLISGRNVDFSSKYAYCLVTVNGFVHRVAGSQYGLVVVDGGRTGRVGANNHVGLLSFKDVGALRTIPISPDMLYKQHSSQQYKDYVMIKSPVDLDDKLVLLSIGGYLHVLDSAYAITGNRSIRVDTNALGYHDRIYDSTGQLNLDPLGLTPSSHNAKQYALDDLYSDRAIREYFCLPQSFIILLDKTDLYVRRHQVEQQRLPGRFLTEMPLKQFPLLSTYGRFYDYAPFPEEGRCVLATDPVQNHRRVYDTGDWEQQTTIDPSRYPSWPWYWPEGFLLEIGRIG